MTSGPPEDIAVFDPGVPHWARACLTLRTTGYGTPRRRRTRSSWIAATAAYLILFAFAPRSDSGTAIWGWFALAAALFFRRRLASSARTAAASLTQRRYHGRFLCASDLDQPSAELLQRAYQAISIVLHADVHQAGELDDTAASEAVLTTQLWDIGRLLADSARLRSQQKRRMPGRDAPADPVVDAIASPQTAILRQVQGAAEARVTILEDYAERVVAADAAYRRWQDVLKLAGLNDQFLDLLARTAADDSAAAEISDLASQADHAEQTFRSTLADARTAADPIVLSAETEPSQLHPPAR